MYLCDVFNDGMRDIKVLRPEKTLNTFILPRSLLLFSCCSLYAFLTYQLPHMATIRCVQNCYGFVGLCICLCVWLCVCVCVLCLVYYFVVLFYHTTTITATTITTIPHSTDNPFEGNNNRIRSCGRLNISNS